MSFLNQLKSQAKALQSERVSLEQGLEERTAAKEQTGKLVLYYLQDLSRHFPTEMRRVEDRLAMGPIKHERREIRKPDSSALVEVRYEYLTQARGSVLAQQALLDELAKRLVGQPNTFL